MQIAVVGAGIVGVTTAYELAVAGHEVTVFERRGSVASESSYANAGVVAPGYVTPWAAPGMPGKVLSMLLSRHAPVRLKWRGALRQWRWVQQWLRACDAKTYAANRTAMLELARFSRQRMLSLTASLQLEYEQRQGYLVLLRSAADQQGQQVSLDLLRQLAVPHSVLDAAGCHAVEPGLNTQASLHAGIHLPQDGVGNCRQFAHQLKAQAQALGASFLFDTEVRALVPGSGSGAGTSGPTAQVRFQDGSARAFQAVVICAGVQAARLLRPLGLALPLLPVYGYSLTAPLRSAAHDEHVMGPLSALMDERYKVAVSRLGQRVRVAGSAELGGRPGQMNAPALATLYKVLDDWFPGAAIASQAQAWKGARPMLPDGPPVLGASGLPGIWLNLGHGSSGWALSCGSAVVLSELISGRDSPISLDRLGFERLGLARPARVSA